VILTPQHAKRLLKALHDNVQKWEKQHGQIVEQKEQAFMPPLNFTPKAQA